MAALGTGSINLPNQKLDPWLGKVQGGSDRRGPVERRSR
jgi:hypothetical protein